MTGRINLVDAANASGVIHAENGARVHFDSSALLAYDAEGLAVGQAVTFELKRGSSTEAVNVWVQKSHGAAPREPARTTAAHIRYMGFEQQGSVRAYRFERMAPGFATGTFILTTDLALFTKHRVAIQEGPALCLRLLLIELDTPGAAARLPQSALTDADLLAHLASRPVPTARRHPRFVPRRPGASRPA